MNIHTHAPNLLWHSPKTRDGEHEDLILGEEGPSENPEPHGLLVHEVETKSGALGDFTCISLRL